MPCRVTPPLGARAQHVTASTYPHSPFGHLARFWGHKEAQTSICPSQIMFPRALKARVFLKEETERVRARGRARERESARAREREKEKERE